MDLKEHQPQPNTRLVNLAVLGLLLLLVIQAVSSMRQKSVTTDEIMYIAAGYYHLKTGDFQLNMTNPPLMKVVSAIPLLLVNPELPTIDTKPGDWNLIEQWHYSRSFLYDNRVDADTMLFLARLSIVVVSVILGLYIFIWGRELYGPVAGLFALFLYSFSPNILAHSRLATQDLGLAAFMFISTYYFWKYSKNTNLGYLILCSLFFGLAVIAKTPALFLLPIFLFYGLVIIVQDRNRYANFKLPLIERVSKTRLRQVITLLASLLIIGLIGMVVVNLGYGLQHSFQPINEQGLNLLIQKLPIGGEPLKILISLLRVLPIPLPGPFVHSIGFQLGLAASSGGVYFAGEIFPDGLWYLMPASFLIKTPLPTMILLVLAVAFLIIQRQKLDAEWLVFLVIAVNLLIFVVFSNTIVGLRYILLIYPFIFLFIGSLMRTGFKHTRLVNGLLILLSIWYLFGTVRVYPNYLTYFNETIGGPKNGYLYLADSNVDWGQDLKGLKRYMDEKGLEKIKLAYFGSADANYYGIDYEYLPSVGLEPKESGQQWWYEIGPEDEPLAPQNGTIAVSATILASPGWMHGLFHESYEWLRQYEPVDQIGNSILIYEIE